MLPLDLQPPYVVLAGRPDPAADQRWTQVILPPWPEQPALPGRAGSKIGEVWVIPPVEALHAGGLRGLVQIVDRLLGPGGCPWDQEQTHQSLKKYLLEECYETLEAIDSGNLEALHEELGDLLLQPLMHTQIRERDGDWGIDSVAEAEAEKLIRRHPHVFGELSVADSAEVLRNWDRIKKQEKGKEHSVLAGVPRAMAALLRSQEVSKRAARVGFEWPDLEGVYEKLAEEVAELRAARDPDEQAKEIGDLLFTVVNLARWMKVDAEEALRQMVDRFTARFQWVEAHAEGSLGELTPAEWEDLWQQAKRAVG